jgi:tripartite-type tricarboxylate transporter receptor subunit TctC
VTGALALLTANAANADTVADFYKGKTITVMIPVGEGGTYDFYGRLGGAAMNKHLPGKPTAVVKNMPGGGGSVVTNYMAQVAAKDGTFLLSMHGSTPQSQLLETTGIKYDLRKFLMIGQFLPLNSSLSVWRATSPATTIEEAKQKEVILGSTGRGSYQYQLPALLNELIGTKFKIVLGYKSIGTENLAMERGEIHGRGGTTLSWAITKPDWIRDNKIAHLVQVGPRRGKGFEDIPLATELVTKKEHKQALNLISGGALAGRSLVGTPGIPADRAAALRKAFDDGMKDPEIQEKAKNWKLDLEPASGAELEKIVNDILDTPPEVVEMVKKIVSK